VDCITATIAEKPLAAAKFPPLACPAATSQVFGKAAGMVNVFGRLSTFAFPRHFRFC